MFPISLYLHGHRQRRQKRQAEHEDLVLAHGEFLIDATGITARLTPPLTRFSRHYGWNLLPVGIAAIKVLVIGRMLANIGLIDDDIVDAVRRRFWISDDVMCGIDTKLYETRWFVGPDDENSVVTEDVEIVDDVVRLVEWGGSTLARHCPEPFVARQLRELPMMSQPQLSRYVAQASLG